MHWVREWWDLIKPFSIGGEYANNLGDEGEDDPQVLHPLLERRKQTCGRIRQARAR
jgi:hypothetical protein